MHIITYATHEERYLPLLKQSCPDLVILGMGEKWNGFQDKVWATVNYCKEHPHEIICFIDGFDSIVLDNEILSRYESFDSPLVMSHAANHKSVGVKYIQDKMFGKCNEERLNSGMYIGTSEAIISFWENYDGGDDQQYATQTCKDIDMKIDTEHLLFYNYSPDDTIQVRHGQLYVNDTQPCVISCPGNASINPYLTELGYTPPDIKYDWTYRFRTYLKHFLPEILLVTIILATLFYVSFPLSIAMSFLLFTTFLEYELHIKHYPISPFLKFICVLIDVVHMAFFLLVLYFIFSSGCNLKKIILLDTMYLIVVLSFFHFKRCIIAIVQNKIIQKTVAWTGPFDRINYFLKPEKQYISTGTTKGWIEANKSTCLMIILANIYCLFKN
jgi:hypothetical protein